MDQSRELLLKPTSAWILTVSTERLELLDAGSQDVSICRRSTEPDPPQAR